jgi:hypothetical protein
VDQVLDDVYGAKTPNNWFNPAAFAQPALGTQGNSGYNAYLGPGNKTVDLSLVRSFRVSSTQRLEARVEAFNAFNWFRAGAVATDPTMSPVTSFSSANFGRILSAGDPRIMQFAVKYQF